MVCLDSSSRDPETQGDRAVYKFFQTHLKAIQHQDQMPHEVESHLEDL